jgi:hypothetical protein
VRLDNGSPALTLNWNKRTRFIEAGHTITDAALSKGAHVTFWYRSPIFGERYAEAIVIGSRDRKRLEAKQ